jgi:hypothetical protein
MALVAMPIICGFPPLDRAGWECRIGVVRGGEGPGTGLAFIETTGQPMSVELTDNQRALVQNAAGRGNNYRLFPRWR